MPLQSLPLTETEQRSRLTSDVVPTMASARARTGVETIAGEATARLEDIAPLPAAVDDAFSQWMAEAPTEELPGTTPEQGPSVGDQQAFRDTFAIIAKLHISPLRELMYHLSVGCTPRAWVTQTRPVLAPLFDAARQTAQVDLLDALSELDTALELAEAENTALVGPVSRGAIQQAYARLGKHMPDTFGIPRSSDGKRLLVLEALLLQVPNVHRRVLTKLYAAGIASIQQLLQGSADELARAAGLDQKLASAIIEHVSRFARERSGLDQARLRSRVAEQMRALVGRLSQLQSEFERAESAGNQVRKKAVRRARDGAVLELQRLVAELGEVELLEELKRSSVRAKVVLMQNYLQRRDHSNRSP
ncbi:MAG TPA: helix-hairpin-helix domain-containing protein [Polyangiales bacterium]|nr:helix-hairpin-helix domain-containing protein [Polyangiales bacterium]